MGVAKNKDCDHVWLELSWEGGKEYQEGKIDWDFLKDSECQCDDVTFNLVGKGEPPDVCAQESDMIKTVLRRLIWQFSLIRLMLQEARTWGKNS